MARLLRVMALLWVSTAHATHFNFDWPDWAWEDHPHHGGAEGTPAPTPPPTPAPTQPPGCSSANDCGGRLCIFNTGVCAGPGSCKDRPAVCPADFNPVCGCDGRTYPNECRAWAVGVSIRREGECDRKLAEVREGSVRCGGKTGRQSCGGAEYCSYEVGACGQNDIEGVCRQRPEICTMEYNPVCGCDGKTYGNACGASGAGVSILRTGECSGARTEEGVHVARPIPAQQQRQGLKGNSA